MQWVVLAFRSFLVDNARSKTYTSITWFQFFNIKLALNQPSLCSLWIVTSIFVTSYKFGNVILLHELIDYVTFSNCTFVIVLNWAKHIHRLCFIDNYWGEHPKSGHKSMEHLVDDEWCGKCVNVSIGCKIVPSTLVSYASIPNNSSWLVSTHIISQLSMLLKTYKYRKPIKFV